MAPPPHPSAPPAAGLHAHPSGGAPVRPQVRPSDLAPGDVVEIDGELACHIGQVPHPLEVHRSMLLWRLAGGGWAHTICAVDEPAGDVLTPHDPPGRLRRLRAALDELDWTDA